jgi:glycosyltransferase involved in cell wall biosynthesis
LRIVHIVGGDSNSSSIRGDERHILSLAAAHQAQGFSVAVMTDAEGLMTEACGKQGIAVIITPPFVLPGKVNSMEGEVSREVESKYSDLCIDLIRMLEDFRPDLIHCHDELPAYSTMAVGNGMNIPCVFTPHIPVGLLFPYLWANRKFAILSIWKSIINDLKENGISESDLYYVPCGTKASSCMYPYEVFDEKPNLIIVGRITHSKGIHTALLSMVELRRRRGRQCPELNIYGGGVLLEYFKEASVILGLDDIVQFHGNRFDILDRCRGSNILVMPSRSETGPLVVLEAMSRGMPIVATYAGDVAEMIPDRRYGRVVPTRSIMTLADAIDATLADVANSRFDPVLLIERHRNLYAIEKMAEGITSVYNQILSLEHDWSPSSVERDRSLPTWASKPPTPGKENANLTAR